MSTEFEAPTFLPKGAKIEPLGYHHNIASLDNLPPDIGKKFPDGIVIKQVDDDLIPVVNRLRAKFGDFRDAMDVFFVEEKLKRKGQEPSANQVVAALNTADFELERDHLSKQDKPITTERIQYLHELLKTKSIAQHFQQQHEFHKQIFGDVLPELVVDSLFVIGQAEKSSKPRIYEIQPRITDYISVGRSLFRPTRPDESEQLADNICHQFTEEQVKHIHEQLRKFRVKFEELYSDQGLIVDLNADNLLITKDGKLKLIDTNDLFDVKLGYEQVMPKALPRFDRLLESLAKK